MQPNLMFTLLLKALAFAQLDAIITASAKAGATGCRFAVEQAQLVCKCAWAA